MIHNIKLSLGKTAKKLLFFSALGTKMLQNVFFLMVVDDQNVI